MRNYQARLACLVGLAGLLLLAGPAAAQTIPTRTPTPGSEPPPPPPPTEPSSGGGDPATPIPTGTPAIAATTTATLPPPSTPEGGYLPTAEPCSTAPTIRSPRVVNVRQGPGLDYVVIYQLVALEVRPIVGRSATAPWWLITLPDVQSGWVADVAIAVQGDTSAVPLVEPPPVNESTPTPGLPWNPTPNPVCTPQPSATPFPTEVAGGGGALVGQSTTATPTPTSSPTVAAETPSAATPTNTIAPTESPAPEEPEPQATAEPALDEPNASTESAVAPIDEPNSSGAASSLLLVGGLALVLVGGVLFVVRSRRQ